MLTRKVGGKRAVIEQKQRGLVSKNLKIIEGLHSRTFQEEQRARPTLTLSQLNSLKTACCVPSVGKCAWISLEDDHPNHWNHLQRREGRCGEEGGKVSKLSPDRKERQSTWVNCKLPICYPLPPRSYARALRRGPLRIFLN